MPEAETSLGATPYIDSEHPDIRAYVAAHSRQGADDFANDVHLDEKKMLMARLRPADARSMITCIPIHAAK